jgi:putative solute:sodium symporter small subunit
MQSALYTLLICVGIVAWRQLLRAQLKSGSAYWRDNITLVFDCLLVWFLVSFGFGILLVEPLNAIRIGGFKLGFWFAQQGSIYIFLGLIFFYAWRMSKLDKQHGVEEQDEEGV